METEHLPVLTPSKQSAYRALASVIFYFLYLVTSFAGLCVYLYQAQHVSAYFIILAWLISVLLLPTPSQLLLNRRKTTR